MGRVLFVGGRNLFEASGEWRLVSSRALALFNRFGLETDALSLVSERHMQSGHPAPEVEGLHVEHVPFRGMADLPFAMLRLRKLVKQRLQDHQYTAFILSGFPTYLLSGLMPKDRTFVDIHGVLEEWLENPPTRLGPAFVRWPLFNLAWSLERWCVRRTAGALVVTDELAEYARNRYSAWRTFVIPCTGDHLHVPDGAEARHTWRKQLGLGHEVAFVYSGGISPHQLLPQVLACYTRLRSQINQETKLVVFCRDEEYVLDLVRRNGLDAKEVVVRALDANEVVKALHACDVGMMLRRDNWTNRVAFPNKFAEYLSAGLITITSPGLRQPARIVAGGQLGVLIDPDRLATEVDLAVKPLVEMLESRSKDWDSFYQRCNAAVGLLSMDQAVEPFGRFVLDEVGLH